MTNPISKAIVKAAVAMGYGKKSDYKGSSVAEVLEKFAAIAKDKGGSDGGVFFVDCAIGAGQKLIAEKTAGEIFEAVESGLIVIFKFTSSPIAIYMYCFSANNTDGYNFAVAVQSGSSFVVNKFTAGDSSDNPELSNK